MQKILITDGLEKEGIDYLVNEGFDVNNIKLSSDDELISTIPEYHALIVRSATKVPASIIESGAQGNLEIIGRSGVGTDNIDVKAATERGVIVKIAPSGASISVSELTMGMMIDVARKITSSSIAMRNGKWSKSNGYELYGKTLGIIGCGRIGRRVSYLAKHGFEMKVLGYDERPNKESGIDFTSLDDLLSQSDYISIHIPYDKTKPPVIGSEQLNKMKKTSYLIDVSRGGNVDEKALYHALEQKIISGAAKDVFVKEGKKFEEEYAANKNPLLELENFLPLPHLGASSYEGQIRTGTEMARVIASYLKYGEMENAINIGQKKETEKKGHIVKIYHDDIPGIFGQIGSIFGRYNVNIYDQPSDPLNNGNPITRYLIDKPAEQQVISEIKSIKGIKRVICEK